MNRPPRNINCSAFIVQLALLLSLSALPARAQQQQRRRSRPQPATKTQAQDAERARRAKALTLLVETADEARSLEDLFYRARLQALAADALWPFGQPRARAVFRRAWEAATAYDKAEQEAAAQEAGATPDDVEPVTEARDEVLAKTAVRDIALAKIFLQELPHEKGGESETTAEAQARATAWHELSAGDARRLSLAFELLDKGASENARRLAMPIATGGVSPAQMNFLLRLSQQDATAGDAYYRYLILNCLKINPAADANSVLILSTPIVSPELMMAIDEYGSLQFRPVARVNSPVGPPQPVPFSTRIEFFISAAGVLLRPTGTRPGLSETQDKAARYFAIGRLLPFFEREAAQFVPELQARANNLLDELTESSRTSLSSQLDVRHIGATPSTDALRADFEERERASDQTGRDRITTRIVLVAARQRSWDRARRAAAELTDEGTRRAANAFIAVNQIADLAHAYADEKEDGYEEIVGFLKSVDVPPLAAAWGYAQAARVAARRKDAPRVAELLSEAEHYAERVDANTSQRVAAYTLIANEAARLDRERAWELLTQLVKAANASENYTGDEISIELRADEKQPTVAESPFVYKDERFRLETIFATMAQLDFERALTNARALEDHVPRVFAQLAIARAALEKKR